MIPDRITWAVRDLAPRPDDVVLEIGCGRGVAAELVCGQLHDGTLVAMDRSATAIAATAERNAAAAASGKLVLRQVDLTDFVDDRRFDKVFAVNVNVFWTGPATAELALVRRLLHPHGSLSLYYETPTPAKAAHLAELLPERLDRAGFPHRVRLDGKRISLRTTGRT